jgi:hypothetical protein
MAFFGVGGSACFFWLDRRIRTLIRTHALPSGVQLTPLTDSMGGAAACICAMFLQRDGFIFESMHTFGAPRFTDHAGADVFRNLFGTLLLRVCHYHDIVRTRPAPSRFRHVGRLVVFHEDDAVWYLAESPTLEPAQNASFSKGFNSHRTSTYADCVRRQLDRILGPETRGQSSFVQNGSDAPYSDDPSGDP